MHGGGGCLCRGWCEIGRMHAFRLLISIRRRLKIVAPEQNLLYVTHTHTYTHVRGPNWLWPCSFAVRTTETCLMPTDMSSRMWPMHACMNRNSCALHAPRPQDTLIRLQPAEYLGHFEVTSKLQVDLIHTARGPRRSAPTWTSQGPLPLRPGQTTVGLEQLSGGTQEVLRPSSSWKGCRASAVTVASFLLGPSSHSLPFLSRVFSRGALRRFPTSAGSQQGRACPHLSERLRPPSSAGRCLCLARAIQARSCELLRAREAATPIGIRVCCWW
jgi:hypothetical protein